MKQKKQDPEQTYAVEKVFLDDKRVNADGCTLVRVKWVGYDETTFEPLETMQPPSKRRAKATVPFGKKTKTVSQPPAKRRKTAQKEEAAVQLDYMSHSLMSATPDDQAMANHHINENAAALSVTLSQASTLAPALSRRSNASRARRENISIEEQMNRSAEMRDLVAQDAGLPLQQQSQLQPQLQAQPQSQLQLHAQSQLQLHAQSQLQLHAQLQSQLQDGTAATAATAATGTTVITPPESVKALYYSGTDDSDTGKNATKKTPLPVKKSVTTANLFPYARTNANFAIKKRPLDDDTNNGATEALIDSAEQNSAVPLLARHHASASSRLTKAMQDERWDENSALENAGDEGKQPVRGAHVCHSTLSTAMEERNYKAYGINSFFRDTQFAEDVELERKLMGVAVRNLCRANKEDENNQDAIARARQQIESAGLGRALVSVHSLCASAKQRQSQTSEPHNLTAMRFDYPLQTDIRCFYDHHRFTNIPIFIPLAFSSGDRETVSILSSICFCSLSCARSWIREKAPSGFRNDNADIMLTIFARKYFAITENIKYAESLLMHEDYGGPLNTRQWRAMGTTHHSILRQPLCVAAPSTIVAEVYVRSRKDAGKVARIVKRTEETHFHSVPERPERNSADAAEASKRKLKEGEGRPLKQRQTVDAQGNRITLDDEHLDRRIAAGAAQRNAKRATQPLTNAKVTHVATSRAKIGATATALVPAKMISLAKRAPKKDILT